MRIPDFEPQTVAPAATCQACGDAAPTPVFELGGVPANSCLLMASRDEAVSFPTGDILLGFCPACGFVGNLAFDPALTEYSDRYEETQAFSATFSTYNTALARELVERHDLRAKRVVEIGCGKGEFLTLLCTLGDNEGIGFDPAFRPDRDPSPAGARMRFVTENFSEHHGGLDADLYCCKMTLEHIPGVGRFLHMLRKAIGD
ncbi:MAG: methyltransferase domain-containing protein, partial [Planctomycetota bacterium]